MPDSGNGYTPEEVAHDGVGSGSDRNETNEADDRGDNPAAKTKPDGAD